MHKVVLIFLVLLASCTGTTTKRVDVSPQANSCQVTEVRPTAMSTIVIGICWDHSRRTIGMTGAGGQPAVSVPLSILGAGATVGGAYLLGSQIGGFGVEVKRGK